MTHPSQEAQKLSDLMRWIDAYAHDYEAQGKIAPTRIAVEREIVAILRSQQPVSGGEHVKVISAYKTLVASKDAQMAQIRKDLERLNEAETTLASEREANAILTNEVDALRAQLARLSAPQAVGWTPVPTSALRWLFGEEGEFECPPDRYFRGKPAPFWWRSVFRDLIAAPPTQQGDSNG